MCSEVPGKTQNSAGIPPLFQWFSTTFPPVFQCRFLLQVIDSMAFDDQMVDLALEKDIYGRKVSS